MISSNYVFASPLTIWANEEGDKVAQDELRVSHPNGRKVINSVWNGATIEIFGAKNEVVNFNLVIKPPGAVTKIYLFLLPN